eukprot:SAG22_NODE_33_length_27588_cov_104.174652_5_plen_90_part_00
MMIKTDAQKRKPGRLLDKPPWGIFNPDEVLVVSVNWHSLPTRQASGGDGISKELLRDSFSSDSPRSKVRRSRIPSRISERRSRVPSRSS